MPWGETETGQKRENRPESAILVQTQLAESPVDGFSLRRLTPRPATRVYEPGNLTIFGPIAVNGSDSSQKTSTPESPGSILQPGRAVRGRSRGIEAGIPMWQNRAALAGSLERCLSLGARRT